MGIFGKIGFFALIKKIVSKVFSFIYLIISAFNLQYTLFLAILGLILFLCGVLTNNLAIAIVFYVLLGLSVIYAVVRTFRRIFGVGKYKKSGVKIIKQESREEQSAEQEERAETFQQKVAESYVEETYQTVEQSVIQPEKPKYFRVKQNPNYLMAEYSDRYELFLVTESGLKKIKTDYK